MHYWPKSLEINMLLKAINTEVQLIIFEEKIRI